MAQRPPYSQLRSLIRNITRDPDKKDIPKAKLNPIEKPRFWRESCLNCNKRHNLFSMDTVAAVYSIVKLYRMKSWLMCVK